MLSPEQCGLEMADTQGGFPRPVRCPAESCPCLGSGPAPDSMLPVQAD